MAKATQRKWNNLDGLYRDVEDARRHSEHGTSEEGAQAWERWLELIDIAMYALAERDAPDMADDADDGAEDDEEHPGDDEGSDQLVIPGTARMEPRVPRGTQAASLAGRPHPETRTAQVTFTARGDRRRGT